MKIAIFGYGTIGSGVGEISLTQKEIEVKYIFDRIQPNLKGAIWETDYNTIFNDDEVELIVETMGGKDFADKMIRMALEHQKNVVTANKEVVALYMDDYLKLSKKNNVNFLFEASVGGGIPIINAICNIKKYDEIKGIYGIINGTTNFILTQMQVNHKTFEEALKEAQALGYAEADPTADLEGLDMVRKISILSMLAKNCFVDINDVYHYGISKINDEFVKALNDNNMILKFASSASWAGNKYQIVVEPVAVKKTSLLANVNEANNAIFVDCNFNGVLMYNGLGAGKFATACAIINDIIYISSNNNYVNYLNEYKATINNNDAVNNFYVLENNKLVLKENITRNELTKFDFYAREM